MKKELVESEHQHRLPDEPPTRRARWHRLPKPLDLSKARHPSNARPVHREQADVEPSVG